MPTLSPRRSASPKTPRVRRPERDLRNAIISLLRLHGIAAWPTGVGAFPATYGGKQRFVRMGTKGMSDVIGIAPWEFYREGRMLVGRFLAIEVKNPGGRVRLEQTAFLQTVVKAGGIGFVAHSCQEVIDKLGLAPGARPTEGAGT